jgi:dihydroxy-acid dehydratase
MSSAIVALGMSLPYSSSNPAVSKDKTEECEVVGAAIKRLLELDLKPKDILTKKSFENAMRLITVLGGSTNAVMHLIAIAHSVDIKITLNDFQRITDSTPFLADLKPSGKYLMEDLHEAGGVPAVMKFMHEKGMLYGDCMTVTGYTIAENLEQVKGLIEGQQVLRELDQPIKESGHLQMLFGNLAEEGAVAKITGHEGEVFEGNAIVYNDEFSVIEGIGKGEVKAGHVVVIRYEGPKGAPGMPEMLKPTSAIMGAGLGKTVAMITDGRFSGGSHGFVVGHVTPEAQAGGTIALVENGDSITIDAINNKITLNIPEAELADRRAAWKAPDLKVNKGALYKYAKNVGSASQGCVTDL